MQRRWFVFCTLSNFGGNLHKKKHMNTTIGVYATHDKAVEAIIKLKEAGFPVSQLSLMGLMETEKVDEHKHVAPDNPLKPAGLGIGAVVGLTVGILTGVGVFAIPGLGFLFGAGAVAGAVAGFDFGIIGGGIATVLTTLGVKDDIAKKYHDTLAAGKFLVVAHGTDEETHKAKKLLHELDGHEALNVH
jgi:hypothetical protein